MFTALIITGIIITSIIMGFLVFASANINMGFYIKSICSINTPEKEVALTFDDGPNARVTPMVLDVLKKYNIKAAFFCKGKNIEDNAELFRRIYIEDHIIGNHTFSHSNFIDFFPFRKLKKELEKTHNLVYTLTGCNMRFFRPPYGVTNPAVAKGIRSMHYITIGWSVRTFDTKKNITAKQLAENTIKKIKPGAIILFHDIFERNAMALEIVIKELLSSGYTIKRLDELIKMDGYVTNNEKD